MRQKWILFCEQESYWSPGTGARLCGVHFAKCSFAFSKRIHLKQGAVPTIKGLSKKICSYMFNPTKTVSEQSQHFFFWGGGGKGGGEWNMSFAAWNSLVY